MAKVQRRVNKKQNKLRHTIAKHENILLSEHPSQHIVVGNGGLGNGVSRETIQQLFSPYGEIVDITMKENKPYCFVSYREVMVAQKAYSDLHGRLLQCPGDVPVKELKLYLSFVETLPGYKIPTSAMPPGLCVMEDFVSPEEECLLLDCIDWNGVDEHMSQNARQSLKHRRVKHYGYEFMYGINNVDKNKPLRHGIPQQCNDIIQRMRDKGLIQHTPDQLTVNQYLPGQGIPPHVDTHSAFEDGIASLSLGSQVVMEFKHPDGRHSSVLLPRRSLLVMSGESRYLWSHGITPRKQDIVHVSQASDRVHQEGSPDMEDAIDDCSAQSSSKTAHSSTDTKGHSAGQKLTLSYRETRTSFTFRKILHRPCDCKFPDECDSQKRQMDQHKADSQPELPTSNEEAQKLESLHVHKVYEEIATHFSDTRHSPWPAVVEFLKSQQEGSVILDIGCGNGKYLGANQTCYQLGCDRSANLCSICEDRGFPVFVSDCLALPVRASSVDVGISIAVIHHLATNERRLSAVREIIRVLRPGGKALIYVWAMEQELNNKKSNYLKDSKIKRTGEEGDTDGKASDTAESLQRVTISEHLSNVSHSNGGLCSDSQTGSNSSNNPSEFADTTNALPSSDTVEGASQKRRLDVHVNRTQFQSQDLLVPWHLRDKQKQSTHESQLDSSSAQKQDSVFHRYYHVFEQGELESLCSSVNNVKIVKSYYDKGNWCVILEKTDRQN